MTVSTPLTVVARLIVQALSSGYALRVPHDGSDASLVESFPRRSDLHTGLPSAVSRLALKTEIGPLPENEVVQLMNTPGLLLKVTRDGANHRRGWLDAGLDGTRADFFCLTQ